MSSLTLTEFRTGLYVESFDTRLRMNSTDLIWISERPARVESISVRPVAKTGGTAQFVASNT